MENAYALVDDDRITALVLDMERQRLTVNQRGLIAGRISMLLHGARRLTVREADAKAVEMCRVCVSNVQRGRAILKGGTAEEIKAVEWGNATLLGMASRVWGRKGPKQQPTAEIIQLPPPSRRRCHIPKLPPGMTPEEAARRGLEMRDALHSIHAAARRLGMHEGRLRMMIDIVMVADRRDLLPADMAVAGRALQQMNADEGRLDAIHDTIRPIMRKLWGNRKGPSRKALEDQRLDRFEHALGILVQACLNGTRIEIPHLGVERVSTVIRELSAAARHIRILTDRLEGRR